MSSVQIRHYENTNVLLNQYHHRIVGRPPVGAARSHPGTQRREQREERKSEEGGRCGAVGGGKSAEGRRKRTATKGVARGWPRGCRWSDSAG